MCELTGPFGTALGIELEIPGAEIDDSLQQVTWRGRAIRVAFGVKIPPECALGTIIGKATTYVERVPVGRVVFQMRVMAATRPRPCYKPSVVGDDARRYRQAFVSYASEDRPEVLKRVQILRLWGVNCFQDILDLSPGERWLKRLYHEIDRADVFLLFWSTRAKNSEWVEKETRYALERQSGNDGAAPEIIPVLIEGPPVPMPPSYLAHLHFNDSMLYFMTDRAE